MSAEQIVARAAQVVAEAPGADIRSFHGVYTSRYRNDPNGAFHEDRQETWFEAPNKYAHENASIYADGLELTWSYGTDGVFVYQYRSDLNRVHLSDVENFYLQDPATTTLKVLPFQPTNLSTLMERARRKLAPARDPRSDPRPPYMYDVKLLGDEQVLGRRAYVLELSLVPGASLQLPDSQVPEKMKMWVDKEIYAVLRIEGWNAEGVVLQSGAYESFEINQSLQFDPVALLAPAGIDIIDTRPVAERGDLTRAWQQAALQARYSVFDLANSPMGLTPGRPWYDARRAVISQQYQGKAIIDMQEVHEVVDASGKIISDSEWSIKGPRMREVTITRLIITQGPPTSIRADGLGPGAPVQIGNLKGLFYSQDDANTLIFDRDGTRIKLYSSPIRGAAPYTSDELVKIAEALQPMEK
jgi:outer membrane lipoprotein-sorting protein